MKANRWTSLVLFACTMLFAWSEAQAFYNPSAGRWLSRDPVGEQGGLNVTGFVENNPVSGVDALGQWAYFQPSTWFDGRGYQPGDVENFNGQLAQSILDGIIPFADPFGDHGGYDKCDNLLAIGRHLGEFSRNAYLMRVNMGLGEWAAAGTGTWRAAAGLTVNGVNLGLSAQAIGTGAGKLSAGVGWGAVDLGLGLLGVKPSISGVMRDGSRVAAGIKTWSATKTSASLHPQTESYSLALGLSRHPDHTFEQLGLLHRFAKKLNDPSVRTYWDLTKAKGLRNAQVGPELENQLLQFMKESKAIHMNIDGVVSKLDKNSVRFALEQGKLGTATIAQNITRWEFYQAWSRFQNKATFYFDGKPVSLPLR